MDVLCGLFVNQTAGNRAVGWQPEPTYRGTYGILSTCIITMLLCIWSAVHLNLPAYRGSKSQTFRKVGWLIMGLIAPEMVAFSAWSQNRAATTLLKNMRLALKQELPSTFWRKTKKGFKRFWTFVKGLPSGTRNLVNSIPQRFHKAKSQIQSIPKHLSNWRAPKPVPMQASIYGEEGHKTIKRYKLLPRLDAQPGQDTSATAAPLSSPNKWTFTHSCYALMGGFAFKPEELPHNFVRGSPSRLTITEDGILFMARCNPELGLDISEDEIEDKSKADGLKKLIVCVQAAWFVASTIFRMSRRYPISLLELNTLAHALCALLIYTFWWSKPLDIKEPTIKDANSCPEILAYFSMASQYNGRREIELFRYTKDENSEPSIRFDARPSSSNLFGAPTSQTSDCGPCADDDRRDENAVLARMTIPETRPIVPKMVDESDTRIPFSVLDNNSELSGRAERDDAAPASEKLSLSEAYYILYMGESLYGFCFEPQQTSLQPQESLALGRPYILLTKDDVRRWRLASEAVSSHLIEVKDGARYVKPCKDGPNLKFVMDHQLNFVVDRAHNWPTNIISFTRFRFRDIPILVTFNIAGFMYGALHLLAWYAPFKTSAERILWKLCGFYLIASGPLFAMIFFNLYIEQIMIWWSKKMDKILGASSASSRGNQSREKVPSWLVRFVESGFRVIRGNALSLMAVYFLFYLAARTYLIVECYVNLFHLDKAAYAVPKWSQYFPHIN